MVLIGSESPTGKLCQSAATAGWLCGLLAPSADQAALEALFDTPTPRLIVDPRSRSRVRVVSR